MRLEDVLSAARRLNMDEREAISARERKLFAAYSDKRLEMHDILEALPSSVDDFEKEDADNLFRVIDLAWDAYFIKEEQAELRTYRPERKTK